MSDIKISIISGLNAASYTIFKEEAMLGSSTQGGGSISQIGRKKQDTPNQKMEKKGDMLVVKSKLRVIQCQLLGKAGPGRLGGWWNMDLGRQRYGEIAGRVTNKFTHHTPKLLVACTQT